MFYIRWVKVWLFVFGGLLFQQAYSKAWYPKLKELIDDQTPVSFSPHTVQIGEYTIWVSNRWYAYAHPTYCATPERRPSISTMIKFSDYLESQAFSR